MIAVGTGRGAARLVPARGQFRVKQQGVAIIDDLDHLGVGQALDTFEGAHHRLGRHHAAIVEGLDRGAWEYQLLHVVQLLVEQCGRTIDDVVGDHADLVTEILTTNREVVIGEVKKRLNVCGQHFGLKRDDEIAALREAASEQLIRALDKRTDCPACESPAVIEGEGRLERAPVLKGSNVLVETVCLPTGLTCPCCGLRLESYAEVEAAERGGTYSVVSEEDAVSFYGEQYLEYMAYEPDYGND